MATLGDLVTNLVANTRPLMSGLNMARGGLSSLASHAAGIAGSVTGSFATMSSQAAGAIGGIVGAFGKVGMAAMGVQAVIGALQGASLPLSLAADAEKLQVSFSTMLGSADLAKKVLGELEQFSAATPFQQDEITDAGRKLLAFGIQADHLIPTLTALGDVSAGVDQPITEMAELFGKAKVQGRLMAEDINQLTGRGIPIIGELAKQFGVAESGVRGLVESGQVNFTHLQTAFASMSGEGGKFSGLMAAQSGTLGGLWSTLTDNVSIALKGVGVAFTEAFDIKGGLESLNAFAGRFSSEWLPTIKTGFETVRSVAGAVIGWVSAKWSEWSSYGQAVFWTWYETGAMVFTGIADTAVAAWGMLTSSLGSSVSSMAGTIGTFVQDAVGTLMFVARHWDSILLIMVENVKLWASNAWAHTTTFFDNLVRWLKWLPGNWQSVLMTLGSLLTSFFVNAVKNASNFFKALFDFAKGKGFKFEAVSLTEGFQNSIKEIPEMAKATVQQTTPELQRLYDELGKKEIGFQSQLAERLRETGAPSVPGGPQPQLPSTTLADIVGQQPQAGQQQQKQAKSAELKSLDARSAEAAAAVRNALQGAGGKKTPQDQIAKNTATTNKLLADNTTALEDITRALTKNPPVTVAPSLRGGG